MPSSISFLVQILWTYGIPLSARTQSQHAHVSELDKCTEFANKSVLSPFSMETLDLSLTNIVQCTAVHDHINGVGHSGIQICRQCQWALSLLNVHFTTILQLLSLKLSSLFSSPWTPGYAFISHGSSGYLGVPKLAVGTDTLSITIICENKVPASFFRYKPGLLSMLVSWTFPMLPMLVLKNLHLAGPLSLAEQWNNILCDSHSCLPLVAGKLWAHVCYQWPLHSWGTPSFEN